METYQTLEDYVFANRNQAYGAYELRQSISQYLRWATIISISLFLLLALAPVLFARLSPSKSSVSAHLTPVKVELETPEIPQTPPTLPPPPTPDVPQTNTYEFKPPVVVADEQVPDDSFLATQEQLQVHQAGSRTFLEGNDLPAIVDVTESSGKKEELIVEVSPKENNEVMLTVEIQPEYPGGMEAFNQYLRKNLRYPTQAQQANVSGNVYLSFVVEKDGSITQLQILKGLGFGCDEEAQRVLQAMPRWKPGRQQGRAVKCRFNLPIAFRLE